MLHVRKVYVRELVVIPPNTAALVPIRMPYRTLHHAQPGWLLESKRIKSDTVISGHSLFQIVTHLPLSQFLILVIRTLRSTPTFIWDVPKLMWLRLSLEMLHLLSWMSYRLRPEVKLPFPLGLIMTSPLL